MKNKLLTSLLVLLLATIFLAACGKKSEDENGLSSFSGDRIKVVATTTIVGDVVSQVGGDHIELVVLLPAGTDPHSFSPTPQDVARVAEADVIFANGAGLEDFLQNLIESAGASGKVVELSEGISILAAAEDGHEAGDPHTWTDPNNIVLWVDHLERVFSNVDPDHIDDYDKQAERYVIELQALDTWIKQQVATIPQENRKIVTDHLVFTYFVDEYGFEQVGTIVPGYSTLSEPSAQEIALLEDTLQTLDVKAVFVGNTINPSVANRITEDTGARLVYLYTGSLSQPGGEAGTYLDYMRYNTAAIVDALTP